MSYLMEVLCHMNISYLPKKDLQRLQSLQRIKFTQACIKSTRYLTEMCLFRSFQKL